MCRIAVINLLIKLFRLGSDMCLNLNAPIETRVSESFAQRQVPKRIFSGNRYKQCLKVMNGRENTQDLTSLVRSWNTAAENGVQGSTLVASVRSLLMTVFKQGRVGTLLLRRVSRLYSPSL